FNHMSRDWMYSFTYQDRSPGFRADFGYMPRVDIRSGRFNLGRLLWGKPGDWYNRIMLSVYGGLAYDYDGNRTDSDVHLQAIYMGPLQSEFYAIYGHSEELYVNQPFNLDEFMFMAAMKPVGGLSFSLMTRFGDSIDYNNVRLADGLILAPALEFNLGRHFNVNLQHTMQRLSLSGDQIFTANLSQLKFVYNFSVRMFVRAIVQYLDIARNPDLFLFPVTDKTNTLFTQFLFSYKLNPQTVLFLGYSDNYLGFTGIDTTQINRTFFVKIGYAWLR
ncbi:MAG: hypothetical protein MUP70_13205, partial [Candidatus Aminicenantes bacterium]|nr:hypothetical protein [Candidatus Aminicenantes bacterium]